MKRIFSLLLTLVILVSAHGCALADTLKLPAQLTAIEGEAFFGASSLDEVDIPWGTESIGSKAFANSGVKKVYIPDTVKQIAEDAFEGTDVTVFCSSESFAYEFAEENNISFSILDEADNVAKILENGVDLHLSAEGLDNLEIDDESLIETIQSLEEAISDYNTAYDNLLVLVNSIDADYDADSNVLYLFAPGFNYSFSLEAIELLSSDYEVGDISNDGNTIQIEITANDETHYLCQTEEGISVSPAPNSRNSRSGSFGDKYDACLEKAVEISSAIDSYQTALNIVDTVSKMLMPYVDAIIESLSGKKLNGIMKGLNEKIELINKITNVLEVPKNCKDVTDAHRMLLRLLEIRGHKHPTEREQLFEYSREISGYLNEKVNAAIWALSSEMLNGLYDAYNALAALKPKGKTNKWIMADHESEEYVAKLFGSTLNLSESFLKPMYEKAHRLYNEAIAYEEQLHYEVYVVVKDKYGNSLSDVSILCAEVYFTTVENDYCSIEIPYSPIGLICTKPGYKVKTVQAASQPYIPKPVNVVLELDKMKVYGNVYDINSNERLSDVEIYIDNDETPAARTDGNGYYQIILPNEQVSLTFRKEKYFDSYAFVTPPEGESVQADGMMESAIGSVFGMVIDEFGDPVPGVDVIIDGSENRYCGTNDNAEYIIYELPAGEHTITFAKQGYKSQDKKITVHSGDNTLNCTLPWQYGVVGTITDNYGSPIPEARVFFRDRPYYSYLNGSPDTTTNENGEYRYMLPPGEYYISVGSDKEMPGGYYNLQYISNSYFGEYSVKHVIVTDSGVEESNDTLINCAGMYVKGIWPSKYTFHGTVSWDGHSVEFPGPLERVICVSASRYVAVSLSGWYYMNNDSRQEKIEVRYTDVIDLADPYDDNIHVSDDDH